MGYDWIWKDKLQWIKAGYKWICHGYPFISKKISFHIQKDILSYPKRYLLISKKDILEISSMKRYLRYLRISQDISGYLFGANSQMYDVVSWPMMSYPDVRCRHIPNRKTWNPRFSTSSPRSTKSSPEYWDFSPDFAFSIANIRRSEVSNFGRTYPILETFLSSFYLSGIRRRRTPGRPRKRPVPKVHRD